MERPVEFLLGNELLEIVERKSWLRPQRWRFTVHDDLRRECGFRQFPLRGVKKVRVAPLPLQYIEVFFRVGNQFTQSAFNAFLA
jgi:hypothetical protein